MTKMNRIAFISNAQVSGVKGGAEMFNGCLVKYLQKYIPIVDHIAVPCSEATFEDILNGYATSYKMDLHAYDGVISSKAPTYAIQHKNHICYLLHTVRVFYDMFDEISNDPSNHDKRQLIIRMDSELLRHPKVKKLFTIGNEVSKRLQLFNGIESSVLHPAIPFTNFTCNSFEYVYMPGRLHKWKRVDLAVKAMKYVKSPVKLKIAGTGDQADYLKGLAGNDSRIEFIGYVKDDEMVSLYSNALCVIFTPIREDYGLIIHEAFHSRKPVITCTDSGEPTYFLKDCENGFLIESNPKILAEKIDILYNDKENAKRMGNNGFETVKHINWDSVAKTLIQALEE